MSDDLGKKVKEILKDFDGNVMEAVNEAVQETGKKAVKQLKVGGAFKDRTGDYRKGWSMEVEKGRLGYTAVVFNKHPGQTTWLEYGHAKQNGGRTRAFPHIASVDDSIEETFLEILKGKNL